MNRLIPLILFVVFVVSCSGRVEYEPLVIQTFPNAININTATAAELEKLPGIGSGIAEAIVEFRATNGPIRRVEHLMLIRGVSEKRLLEIRPLLRTE